MSKEVNLDASFIKNQQVLDVKITRSTNPFGHFPPYVSDVRAVERSIQWNNKL